MSWNNRGSSAHDAAHDWARGVLGKYYAASVNTGQPWSEKDENGRYIRSYSTEMGRIYKGRNGQEVAILNVGHYSVTTSRHQNAIAGAVSHLPCVRVRSEVLTPRGAYDALVKALKSASFALKADRERAADDWQALQTLCDNFKLPKIPAGLEPSDERKAADKERRRKEAERQRTKLKKAQAKLARMTYGQKVDAWKDGKDLSIEAKDVLTGRGNVFAYPDGDQMRTSKCMSFPLKVAKRILARRNDLKEGDTILEHYTVKLTAETICANCHCFDRAVLDELAAGLGV